MVKEWCQDYALLWQNCHELIPCAGWYAQEHAADSSCILVLWAALGVCGIKKCKREMACQQDLWEHKTKSRPNTGIPMAGAHVICCSSISWNRSMVRRHGSFHFRDEFLGCNVSQFCGGFASRHFGQHFSKCGHMGSSFYGNCHVHNLHIHVEDSSFSTTERKSWSLNPWQLCWKIVCHYTGWWDSVSSHLQVQWKCFTFSLEWLGFKPAYFMSLPVIHWLLVLHKWVIEDHLQLRNRKQNISVAPKAFPGCQPLSGHPWFVFKSATDHGESCRQRDRLHDCLGGLQSFIMVESCKMKVQCPVIIKCWILCWMLASSCSSQPHLYCFPAFLLYKATFL